MLADVHAKFGGRPPRSRRAARPPSWRRRRDRTPRIRAAHQSRSTTSEGLRGCPPDVGCTPDLIFPGARPSGAPVRTRHRTRRAASRDPTPFARWSGSIRIGTDWRMWPMPSPRAPAALLVRSGLSWCARHRCGKSSLISCPTSLGRTGGGLLFMDDRPSKNPPRPSNVSTCRRPPVCNVVPCILWRTFRERGREKTILYSPSRNYDGAARRRPDSDRCGQTGFIL